MYTHRAFVPAFILVASAVFLSGCQPKPAREASREAIPVRVMPVKLQEFNESIAYVGDIKAQDEAMVYPKVSGKISEKVKEEGQAVEKGEAIAYIDRDEVGLTFAKAPVESPLSAVVGRVYVDIGANVTPQTAVALVVNMDKVKIGLNIPEKYLPKVSIGQEAGVMVDAYPGEKFTGVVTKIDPVLDQVTRSASVEITADNPEHRLKSGMFARAELILQRHKDVPVILQEAILGKEPNFYVYAVEGNKAVLKYVTLGIYHEARYEVKEGLKEGDKVVIMGQQRLYDGAAVSAEETNE